MSHESKKEYLEAIRSRYITAIRKKRYHNDEIKNFLKKLWESTLFQEKIFKPVK